MYEVPADDRGDDANSMSFDVEAGSEVLKWLNPKTKTGKAAKSGGGGFGGMGGMGMAGMMAGYEVAERSFRPYKVHVEEAEE